MCCVLSSSFIFFFILTNQSPRPSMPGGLSRSWQRLFEATRALSSHAVTEVSEVTLPPLRLSPKLLLNAVFPDPSRHRHRLRWPAGAGVPRLSELAQQPGAGSVALRGTRPAYPDAGQHYHESVPRSHY